MNHLNATVFVVEDDAQTRASFSALASSLGLPTQVFPSAEDFLRDFDPSRPGCVVADLRLPGIDGLELHRRLLRVGSRLPVILISAHLGVRTTAAALEQGIFRVLEKPYRNDELAQAVMAAIQHDRSHRKQVRYRLDFAHRLESLDPRERLTLDMIVAGNGSKAVERKLGVSTRTVDRIKSSILGKMSFLSFVELSAAYGAAQTVGPRVAGPELPDAELSGPVPPRVVTNHAPTQPPVAANQADWRMRCCDVHDKATLGLASGLARVQTMLAQPDITEEHRLLLRDAAAALSEAIADIGEIVAGKSFLARHALS